MAETGCGLRGILELECLSIVHEARRLAYRIQTYKAGRECTTLIVAPQRAGLSFGRCRLP